ncbi:MAG TPA: hypothetical protein VHC00_15535 [Rhizobiaceae bacterium]|nr:hypothetical protein [Rhizobiaceae bacterium]
MASTPHYPQFLRPADLTMVRRVLQKICVQKAIEVPSAEAETLAANLIHAFQHGAREEKGLLEAAEQTRIH